MADVNTVVVARPMLKWGAATIAAIGLLWAAEAAFNRKQALAPAPPPAPTVHVWEDSRYSAVSFGRSYAQALKLVDAGIVNARAAADAGRDQWLMHELLAGQYLMRAQLTGSYDDYVGADAALIAAFKVAVPKSGPHMMHAKLDFSMHRLAAAEAKLAAMDQYFMKPAQPQQAEMAAMRGDIAFYSGQYPAALALYDRADALAPGTATFNRAIYALRTGAADQADALFARAITDLQPPMPQVRAYLDLQRGILDLERGRLDDALVHSRDGARIFPLPLADRRAYCRSADIAGQDQ